MVNYSKGLIYKLCCNDPTVTDIYVGSTTNFSRRKAEHKYSCNNEDAKAYNTLVYKFIRENGSWVNWSMVLVREYETTSKQKLKRKERKYIDKLGATLNKVVPSRTKKERYDNNRDEILQKNRELYKQNKQHESERKKLFYEKNKERILQRQAERVECECGYITRRASMSRHKSSEKHTRLMNEL